jgi:hypothetical protein
MLKSAFPRTVRRLFTTTDEVLRGICKEATNTAYDTALKVLKNPMGWELVERLEDTEVLRNTKFPDSHVYRRQGRIAVPPMKVISYVRNVENTKAWNDPIIEAKVVRNLGEHQVIYQKVTMPWPLSIRDLVFADSLRYLDNGCAYVMVSIDYPDPFKRSEAVHSQLNWAVIMAEDVENFPDSSFVTYASSWQLKEETASLREVNYLVQKRNPFMLRLRKMLVD